MCVLFGRRSENVLGSVLQCAAVCCSVLLFVAPCCTVLQCVAVCCLRDRAGMCVDVCESEYVCAVACVEW